MIDPIDIRLGDKVRMRKPHACGGADWQVVRLGTDIGIVCMTCHHRVLLPRSKFARRVKSFLERGPEVPPLPSTS
ncbi:MAG: DUF951 domain-containing protein [Anaerolineae bacterium]|nr:DUF951 domain-containing protein [Anaerolineae bacterium]